MAQVEKDDVTGQDTTGHEWDGIKELDTPLPKWWLYTFYACIVWSVGYWVLYPAWPYFAGHTQGVLEYSSRATHEADLVELKQSRASWSAKFAQMDVNAIGEDQQLLNYAMAGGKIIFAENCAPCHGTNGSGAPGYPILADDDWIWGGTRDDIYATVRYGVRSGHEDERDNTMPSFGADELLTKDEITDVIQFVLALSGAGSDADAAKSGAVVFEDNCAGCHGEDGKGMRELGGPNLADGIGLYGTDVATITSQIFTPKHGVMPAWNERLDDVTIKQVALYVHSLGGGE